MTDVSAPAGEAARIRSPIIVNQGGAIVGERIAAHWSSPRVIQHPKGAPPWEIPPEADVLVTQPAPWQATAAPSDPPPGWPFGLRFIQVMSTGVDTFPPWLFAGPPVACGRGAAATQIAEYVLTAILAFEKEFAAIRVRDRSQWKMRPLGSLSGKTLGLAGYGAIGRAIAARAQPFGVRIFALKRGEGALDAFVERAPDLASLIAEADHLALAMPLTPLTRRILNAAALARAKPSLHIVNVARGGLVDEEALRAALDEGRIAGATLDVTDPEPPAEGDWLYSHPKVWLTPHISWGEAKSGERVAEKVIANLDRYVRGEPLQDIVDPARGY